MRSRRFVPIAATAMLAHIAMCAFSFWCFVDSDLESLGTAYVANLASDLVVLFACTIVFSSILLDRRLSSNTHIFMAMLTFEAVLLTLDIQNWLVNGHPELRDYNLALNYGIYGLIYVLIVSFVWYISEIFGARGHGMKRLKWTAVLISVIGLVLLASNYRHGIYFTIDGDGWYQRADTFMISMVCPSLISLMTACTISRHEPDLRRKAVFLSFILIPYGAAVIQSFLYGISLQYISFMLALLIIYANIYVSRSQDLLSSESEMLRQRADAMISQIQPHFLYNVLTSIMNIKGSSEESREAIVDFSRYLRFNLDSTRATYPIPITAEIDHVETFINLRRLHYGDKLELDTDIQDRNIHVPPQSIKVLVQSLMECDIEDTDLMMITLSTVQVGRDHVVKVGYGGPSSDMESYLESESYNSVIPTIERLRRSVGCRFAYTYEPDDYAEITLTIPIDGKVSR